MSIFKIKRKPTFFTRKKKESTTKSVEKPQSMPTPASVSESEVAMALLLW